MSKDAGIKYLGKAKDGRLKRYQLTAYLGYDGKGVQIKRRRTVYVTGIVEARKKRAEFITELETGEYVAPSNTTLKVYSEKQYMKDLKTRVTDSTIDTYQRLLNNYIYEHLGGYQMEKITHNHIKKYIQELEALDLASSTINKHFNILNGIFKLAVTNEVIKSNPMDKVQRPTVKYKKGKV